MIKIRAIHPTVGITSPPRSRGLRALSVRRGPADCLHALEEAVTLLDIPFAIELSGGSVRSKDARGFVVGDDAEYAFACTIISLWEGARA